MEQVRLQLSHQAGHTPSVEQMLEYGTRIVAGVTPGKGGQRACDGKVPVFDTATDAVADTGANVSIVYVPARFAADAVLEAADAKA